MRENEQRAEEEKKKGEREKEIRLDMKMMYTENRRLQIFESNILVDATTTTTVCGGAFNLAIFSVTA